MVKSATLNSFIPEVTVKVSAQGELNTNNWNKYDAGPPVALPAHLRPHDAEFSSRGNFVGLCDIFIIIAVTALLMCGIILYCSAPGLAYRRS
jgi:hypothetical protein